MELKVTASAPSNIALIKYMGKTDHQINAASNPSISYTLPHLTTKVSIEVTQTVHALWRAEETSPLSSMDLSESGKNKFLAHWDRCHQRMAPSFQQGVTITSGNNFPSDCGLASSASSFAALTLAAHELFLTMGLLVKPWTRSELAQLSREGSGSSCRSFFAPWVEWSGESVRPLENTAWTGLLHSAIVVDRKKKKVSSSEAHRRIVTSSLYPGRIERAKARSERLQQLLKQKDSWYALFELVWSEFWDMHVLFETSSPPFYYMSPQSLLVLRYLQNDWEQRGDGPLITMDAGPNIHLLYRANQFDLQQEHLEKLNKMDLFVLTGATENANADVMSE